MDQQYDSFSLDLALGHVVPGVDRLYTLLVTSEYVFDPLHARRSDITGEVDGLGYEAGGRPMENVSSSLIDGRAVLTADMIAWRDSTLSAEAAIVYKHRGDDPANDELVAYHQFGLKHSSTGPFEVDWTQGFLTLGGR